MSLPDRAVRRARVEITMQKRPMGQSPVLTVGNNFQTHFNDTLGYQNVNDVSS